MVIHILLVFAVMCSAGYAGIGVPEIVPEPQKKKWRVEDVVVIEGVDFVNMSADTIIDPKGAMRDFYKKLHELSENGDRELLKVSIAHYGDSHIQGGDITRAVMHRMQRRFGNAGRGLVVPHRIAKTNEPRDYRITTPNVFLRSRLIDLSPEFSAGVAGMGIKSDDKQQQFRLYVLNNQDDTLNYSFNRVVVFHDSLAPIITAEKKLMAEVGAAGDESQFGFTTEIDLLSKSDSVMLYTYKRDQYKDGSFYGFSLENGQSGVLYHAMGINGSCYLHWGRNPQIIDQSRGLNPELIIISMGSNEASGRNFIEDVFYREVDSFVRRIRSANPGVAVLLTTPPEAMRKTKRTASPNPNFEKIRNTIVRYGQDKGVAVFDLYGATGGSGSSKKWVQSKMMQGDYIHYNKEGYTIQGLLIYGAILDGYKKSQAR